MTVVDMLHMFQSNHNEEQEMRFSFFWNVMPCRLVVIC